MLKFVVAIDRDDISDDQQHKIQRAIEDAVQQTVAGLDIEPPLDFRPLEERLELKGLDFLRRPDGGRTAGIIGNGGRDGESAA